MDHAVGTIRAEVLSRVHEAGGWPRNADGLKRGVKKRRSQQRVARKVKMTSRGSGKWHSEDKALVERKVSRNGLDSPLRLKEIGINNLVEIEIINNTRGGIESYIGEHADVGQIEVPDATGKIHEETRRKVLKNNAFEGIPHNINNANIVNARIILYTMKTSWLASLINLSSGTLICPPLGCSLLRLMLSITMLLLVLFLIFMLVDTCLLSLDSCRENGASQDHNCPVVILVQRKVEIGIRINRSNL